MFKIISSLLLLLSFANATDVSQTSQDIRSYPFVENKMGIRASYSMVNSGLDIFGIRAGDVGEASDHGSFGNLNRLDVSLGYGYNEYVSIVGDIEYQDLEYAGESLKNTKEEIFVKLNIYHNPSAMIDTFSTDIGFIHNGANDLTIQNSSLGISKMDDMSDSSFYMRFLAGTKIMTSVLDFYLGLKFTDINTKLNTISYDRSEVVVTGGFQYTAEIGSFLLNSGWEYIRLVNRDVENIQNSNHIFNLSLSKILGDNILTYIGLKYFIHQYNGVIPYLYNDKTKKEFGGKYGYATIGFVYNFDFDFNMDGLNQPW
jgi:hypothetical protein